jgi:hypothetical protein
MVSKRDYNAEMVAAARSVLLELTHLLGAYREQIVLVGGWVPEMLLPGAHVGSLDVDLALDHRRLDEAGYKTIKELLLSRGYEEGKQPFIYHRKMKLGDREVGVQVDLLAGEYEGTGARRRHQKMQGVQARKARGCDLAFERVVEVTVEGELPDGGKDSARVRVAAIVPFLVMKAMALHDRLKEKDAWDIVYCLRRYPGGLDALAEAFRPLADHGLVREGLEKLAEKFASESHVGPKFVADFEEVTGPEERALIQRDAFERVQYLLSKIAAQRGSE